MVVVPLHTYLHEMEDRLRVSQKESEERLRVSQKESEARLMTFITNTVSLFSEKFRADMHKNNIILTGYILTVVATAGAGAGYLGFYIGHPVLKPTKD